MVLLYALLNSEIILFLLEDVQDSCLHVNFQTINLHYIFMTESH